MTRSTTSSTAAIALRRLVSAALLGAVFAGAPRARAEPPDPPAPIVFVIDFLPWSLDAEELRAAVARELGARVTLADRAGAPNTLTLRAGPAGHVVLSYRAADGHLTERTLDLPGSREPAVKVLALLAGNLVRDEAAELTALLKKKRAGTPPLETPPADAVPLPAPSPSAPDPTLGPPSPSPPALPAPQLSPLPDHLDSHPPDPRTSGPAAITARCVPEGAPHGGIGVDFAPFVGTSSFTGLSSVRRFSLNILGGVSAGLDGFEMGGLVNVESAFTCGAQFAGIANLTLGPVHGAQVSVGVNLGLGLRGLQVGLVDVAVGDGRGAQLGLVDVTSGAFSGVQMGLIEVAAGDLRGGQIGLVNVGAGAVHGAQVGLVNVAGGAVTGVQVGLVNVAETCSFCLGLVNVIRRGRLHLDLWGQESGLLMAGVKHGGDHFHSIYGIGVEPFGRSPRLAFALGIGGHLPLSERFFTDLDLIGYSLHDLPSFTSSAMLVQARLVLGVRVALPLAIYAGPSFNVANTSNSRDAGLSPYPPSFALSTGIGTVQGGPGAVLGLQAL